MQQLYGITVHIASLFLSQIKINIGRLKHPVAKPIRKLWYNLTITAASVIVALFIGGIEALGLIGDKLGLEGGFWGAVGSLNDNLANFGFAVVGIFIASWLISILVYRAIRGDEGRSGRQSFDHAGSEIDAFECWRFESAAPEGSALGVLHCAS